MSWQFDVVAGPFGFTEGPAWDGQALVFSDIPSSRILRYDPESGEKIPGISTNDIYLGVLPFVGMQLIVLAMLIAWPQLVLHKAAPAPLDPASIERELELALPPADNPP